MNHCLLEKDDGVIMGPSTLKYYEQNLKAMECVDDLHEDIVNAFDDVWKATKGECPVYFR